MDGMRERLPNRRFSENFEVVIDNQRLIVTVGRYPDGRVGEVFVSGGVKIGSSFQTVLDDACIMNSVLIQRGFNIEGLLDCFGKDDEDNPSSILGHILRIALAVEQEEFESSIEDSTDDD